MKNKQQAAAVITLKQKNKQTNKQKTKTKSNNNNNNINNNKKSFPIVRNFFNLAIKNKSYTDFMEFP